MYTSLIINAYLHDNPCLLLDLDLFRNAFLSLQGNLTNMIENISSIYQSWSQISISSIIEVLEYNVLHDSDLFHYILVSLYSVTVMFFALWINNITGLGLIFCILGIVFTTLRILQITGLDVKLFGRSLTLLNGRTGLLLKNWAKYLLVFSIFILFGRTTYFYHWLGYDLEFSFQLALITWFGIGYIVYTILKSPASVIYGTEIVNCFVWFVLFIYVMQLIYLTYRLTGLISLVEIPLLYIVLNSIEDVISNLFAKPMFDTIETGPFGDEISDYTVSQPSVLYMESNSHTNSSNHNHTSSASSEGGRGGHQANGQNEGYSDSSDDNNDLYHSIVEHPDWLVRNNTPNPQIYEGSASQLSVGLIQGGLANKSNSWSFPELWWNKVRPYSHISAEYRDLRSPGDINLGTDLVLRAKRIYERPTYWSYLTDVFLRTILSSTSTILLLSSDARPFVGPLLKASYTGLLTATDSVINYALFGNSYKFYSPDWISYINKFLLRPFTGPIQFWNTNTYTSYNQALTFDQNILLEVCESKITNHDHNRCFMTPDFSNPCLYKSIQLTRKNILSHIDSRPVFVWNNVENASFTQPANLLLDRVHIEELGWSNNNTIPLIVSYPHHSFAWVHKVVWPRWYGLDTDSPVIPASLDVYNVRSTPNWIHYDRRVDNNNLTFSFYMHSSPASQLVVTTCSGYPVIATATTFSINTSSPWRVGQVEFGRSLNPAMLDSDSIHILPPIRNERGALLGKEMTQHELTNIRLATFDSRFRTR